MLRNRILKSAFIGVFLLITGIITVNFLTKLSERQDAPTVDPLADDTAQLSREVEFRNYDGGDVVFRVRSAQRSINQDGVQDLAKVHLDIFRPPQRELADQVWAENARYDDVRKVVQFEQDVAISLEDGTEIRSQRASADLGERSVHIEEAFSLKRGKVEGEGRGLLYHAGENRVDVHDGIHLRIPEQGGVTDIRALSASYWTRLGRLLLVGKCRIKGLAQSLESERVDIQLTEQQELQLVTASGRVVFGSADTVIEGDSLKLEFSPGQGGARSFLLASKSDERAVYRSGSGGPILRARLMAGEPAPRNASDTLLLRTLEATGDVEVEWREAGIDRVQADHMTGTSGSGPQFEELVFTGQSEMVRHTGQGRETIRCEGLRATFVPGSALLQQLLAQGRPVLVADGSPVNRTLEAEDEIRIFFQEGQLARLETLGRSSIVEQSATERTVIRAAGFSNYYENALPASLTATGGVHLERGLEKPLMAQSRDMRVTYNNDGSLKEVEFLGDLELVEEGPDSLFQLSGQKGILSSGGGLIELTGEPFPVLQSLTPEKEVASRTTAARLRLDGSSHAIQADGEVETRVHGDQPLIIHAESMEAGGGSSWIRYEGRPRLEFGENRIESDRMRLESKELLLEADGSVAARLQATGAEPGAGYRVKADRLTLDRQAREAVFSGSVWSESEEFEVESSEMNLQFDGPGLETLLRMTALGEVTLSEEGRIARGDKAVYLPAGGHMTVEGEPAQVTDSKRGKALGRKLTFTVGDDTLLVEGQQ